MASLPTRTTASFDAIKPVSSLVLLDNEFNQYVGASGILNGGTTGTKLLVKTSDATDPPVDCDQVGAGALARFKLSGTAKVTIGNDGLITCANTGINPGLNADRLDSKEGSEYAVLATNVVPWSATWFVADPSTAATATEEYPSVLVPTGSTTFKITALKIEYRGGSHTGGSFARFKIARRGAASADMGTIEVNDTNNTAFTLYSNDIADVTLTSEDRLVFTLDARGGTVTERNVSVFAVGTRLLT